MTFREMLAAWWYRHGGIVLYVVLALSLSAGVVGSACWIGEVKGEAR